jgi:hypothetical protein
VCVFVCAACVCLFLCGTGPPSSHAHTRTCTRTQTHMYKCTDTQIDRHSATNAYIMHAPSGMGSQGANATDDKAYYDHLGITYMRSVPPLPSPSPLPFFGRTTKARANALTHRPFFLHRVQTTLSHSSYLAPPSASVRCAGHVEQTSSSTGPWSLESAGSNAPLSSTASHRYVSAAINHICMGRYGKSGAQVSLKWAVQQGMLIPLTALLLHVHRLSITDCVSYTHR